MQPPSLDADLSHEPSPRLSLLETSRDHNAASFRALFSRERVGLVLIPLRIIIDA